MKKIIILGCLFQIILISCLGQKSETAQIEEPSPLHILLDDGHVFANDLQPVFEWTDDSDSNGEYVLQISQNKEFGYIYREQSLLNGTSLSIENPLKTEGYYVRVGIRQGPDNEISQWSDTVHFYVAFCPPVLSSFLLQRDDDSSLSGFVIDQYQTADSVSFEVAETSDFQNILYSDEVLVSDIKDSILPLKDFSPFGFYYVRFKTSYYEGKVVTDWSEGFRFQAKYPVTHLLVTENSDYFDDRSYFHVLDLSPQQSLSSRGVLSGSSGSPFSDFQGNPGLLALKWEDSYKMEGFFVSDLSDTNAIPTQTEILLDNGSVYGANSIKKVVAWGDGQDMLVLLSHKLNSSPLIRIKEGRIEEIILGDLRYLEDNSQIPDNLVLEDFSVYNDGSVLLCGSYQSKEEDIILSGWVMRTNLSTGTILSWQTLSNYRQQSSAGFLQTDRGEYYIVSLISDDESTNRYRQTQFCIDKISSAELDLENVWSPHNDPLWSETYLETSDEPFEEVISVSMTSGDFLYFTIGSQADSVFRFNTKNGELDRQYVLFEYLNQDEPEAELNSRKAEIRRLELVRSEEDSFLFITGYAAIHVVNNDSFVPFGLICNFESNEIISSIYPGIQRPFEYSVRLSDNPRKISNNSIRPEP